MAHRFVILRAFVAVMLAACAAVGAPGASLRLLPSSEKNADCDRDVVEVGDHVTVCSGGPRRARARTSRPHDESSVLPPATRTEPVVHRGLTSHRSCPLQRAVPLRC